METVYIETTIVSYLVARPSRDLILAAHQQLTRDWWGEQRLEYRCVTSEEVLQEAARGEPQMSQQRLTALTGLIALRVDEPLRALARGIIKESLLPPAATSDAIHAAAASFHGMDYLLTWNCRHLANPHLQKNLRALMAKRGLVLPEICTPIELMGD